MPNAVLGGKKSDYSSAASINSKLVNLIERYKNLEVTPF